MKRAIRWILILAALVVVVVALRLTVLQPDPVPVTVYRVDKGLVEDTVTNSRGGTIETRHRASLSPEVGGIVAELLVAEGDEVTAGQALLRLEASEYRAELQLRQRSLETAQATERQACLEAEQAERDLVRYLKLARDDLVSPETLDQFQSVRDVAVVSCERGGAATREAGAALAAARTRFEKTELRAPFAGVVAEVKTELGEYVMPSPPGIYLPPVVDLFDPAALYVSAPLDEVDVGRVTAGRSVRVTMDPYPGRSFAGTVTRVAPYVQDMEKQNRTFEVEVSFEDEDFARTLLPGTSADVEVILDVRDDVLRIPSYALIEGGQVLVVNGDRLEAVPVEVGLKNWAFAEVVSGLAEGDPVVVSLDRVEVKEGALARIEAETDR